MSTSKPGWQQPAVVRPVKRACPHLGLLGAVLSLHLHDVGHVWICTCGARFTVVSDGPGGPKKLKERRR